MKKEKPITGTKFSIAMPNDLLAELDAACARSGGIGRAAMIRSAVKQMLRRGNIDLNEQDKPRQSASRG